MELTIKIVGLEVLAEAISSLAGGGFKVGQQQPPEPVHTEVVVPMQEPPKPHHEPVQVVVPTSEPSFTMDDLAKAAITLMDAGHGEELQQLLAGYGVQSLPELQKEQYGLFATALRGLGAQI